MYHPVIRGIKPYSSNFFTDSFFENLGIHQNFTTFRKFSMRFNLSASGKKVCVWLRPQGLRVPLSIDKKHAQPEKRDKNTKKRTSRIMHSHQRTYHFSVGHQLFVFFFVYHALSSNPKNDHFLSAFNRTQTDSR